MKNFMQQLALLVFSILSVSNASAQDGVLIDYSGTTRDASAILDLRSTNQGVLVPRVDIIDLSTAAPVTTPATGLLVYNSNVTSGVGYYYWNGLLWTRLIDGTGSNNVTGNGIQNYLTKWNNAAGTTIGNSRIFDNGTNVGIGNVLPDAPLTIGDGTNSAAYLNIRRSDNPHIQLFEGTTSAARIQGDIVSTHPQFQITTSNGATSLFNVNQDNGRVGIGTTAPNSLLDVTGSNAEVFINNNIGNAGIVGIRLTHGVVATQQKVGIFSEAVGTWGKGHLHFAVNIADDLTNTTVSDTKLTINGTTGYVGIGTPTPSSKLEVKATEGATGGIRLANSSGYGPLVNIYQVGADGHIDLYTGNNPTILRTHITSYGDTYFNAASTGNVGVGLTNPGAKLTIRVGSTDPGTYDNGKALFVSSVSNPGTNFDGNIEFRHDNLSQGIGFGYQSIYATGFNANQDLNIYARGTGNLTLNAYGSSTGYVGIGIAAPASQLSIASLRADGSGISSDGIKFQYDGTFSRAGIYSDGSAGYGGILKFATNAGVNSHTLTDRMTIIASGYVGIGTTAPKAPLEVAIISTASGTQTGSSYGYFALMAPLVGGRVDHGTIIFIALSLRGESYVVAN